MSAARGDSKSSLLERIEVRAQHAFEWIEGNRRLILLGLAGAIVVGLAGAGTYEWIDRRENASQEALAEVERSFAEEMAGDPRLADLPEPANADQARQAREKALAGFEAVRVEHSGSRAADFAWLRAAEMEVDLGQIDAATRRLAELDRHLDRSDPLRAIALRLAAYARDLKGEYLEAGAAYEEAAQVESYPDTSMLWLAAAQSFERAGAADRAVLAYQEVLTRDPELGEREGVLARVEFLEQASYRTGGAGAAEALGSREETPD
jgi:tetratricopeptide (TPR) repeat protein